MSCQSELAADRCDRLRPTRDVSPGMDLQNGRTAMPTRSGAFGAQGHRHDGSVLEPSGAKMREAVGKL